MFLLCAFIYVTLSTSQRRDSELSSKLTKANNDITAINNIIKNVEIKKTNLKVAANSDFRWTWDLPTISGYYPLEVLT